MKTKLILLVLAACWLFSCKESGTDPVVLELSAESFSNITSGDTTLQVEITSSADWTVRSDAQWCVPVVQKGSGDYTLKIAVGVNIEQKVRAARLTVSSGASTRYVRITQKASIEDVEDYHYSLPVVFHVLYKDRDDRLQYVEEGRLAQILTRVNELYRSHLNSPEMNLEFILPETDPEGNTMEEPGVDRVQWSTATIDCEKFMSDQNNTYTKLMWDPNKYINVMIYNFTDEGGNMVTLGISHLPYSVRGSNQLEGLNQTSNSYIGLSQLKYAHCVSINSKFIYDESIGNTYYTTDVNVTLAHELGHYLGLHHVFSEDHNGNLLDGCVDSDYCEDTPTYNKVQYDDDYARIVEEFGDKAFPELVKRTDCSGEEFTSYNIMDYSISYSNQFTDDQRTRIRHVLNYSPLIPGPKIGLKSRASSQEKLDLPMRIVR